MQVLITEMGDGCRVEVLKTPEAPYNSCVTKGTYILAWTEVGNILTWRQCVSLKSGVSEFTLGSDCFRVFKGKEQIK